MSVSWHRRWFPGCPDHQQSRALSTLSALSLTFFLKTTMYSRLPADATACPRVIDADPLLHLQKQVFCLVTGVSYGAESCSFFPAPCPTVVVLVASAIRKQRSQHPRLVSTICLRTKQGRNKRKIIDTDRYIYIYIYICSPPPPPHDPHIWPREGWFWEGGDSRLQISRKNLEYPQTPDSRFPEKIWSTTKLQTPDFQKKSGVPGPCTPDSGVCNLESGAAGTPDFFWKSGVWSLGPPGTPEFFLEIWSLESGAPWYSRFFLEIWSLESGAAGTPDFFWKSGVWSPGPGTPDFFWKSGVSSPSPGYSRFFRPGTPDFFWKSGVWSPGPGYSRFFWQSGVWSPGPMFSICTFRDYGLVFIC